MKLRMLFAATALAFAPGLAIAQGCGWHSDKTAMSCAEGMTLDPETNTCVKVVTG